MLACDAADQSVEHDDKIDLSRLPGLYSGTYPCSNCPGIDVRLWLRSDGGYFLRQNYLATEDVDDHLSYGTGRWFWSMDAGLLTLQGRGPQRRFAYSDGGRLDLYPPPTLEHSLFVETPQVVFTESFRMEGEYVATRGSETFTECLTGIQFSLNDGGERQKMRRQHRLLSLPQLPALTVIQAQISSSYDQTTLEPLAVERLLSMKPNTECKVSSRD